MLFPWELEGLADEAECRQLLLPLLGDIGSCVCGGWEEWMSGVEEATRLKVSAFARGGVVHELIADRATRLLGQHDDVDVCTDDFFKLYVADRLVLRVKKVASDHRVMLNWARPNTRDYYRNAPVGSLRHGVTRLTIGYVLDFEEASVEDVVISQQIGDVLLWSYSALEEYMAAGSVSAQVTPPGEADVVVDDDESDIAADGGA